MALGAQLNLTATMTLQHDTTKKEIIDALQRLDIPDHAKLNVDYYKGDQRDPSYTKLIWSWRAE